MNSKQSPEAAEMEQIQKSATAFATQKGWRPADYRVEYKSKRPDGNHVVHLVYLEDERRAVPGGGESVELFIDPASYKVVGVYHFQ